jgi:hypothetical protein
MRGGKAKEPGIRDMAWPDARLGAPFVAGSG